MLMDAVGEHSTLDAWLRPYALVYAKKADEDGTNCFCGVGYVAGYLGRSPEIARRARNELIRLGVLRADEVIVHGRRRVKVHFFDVSKLPGITTERIADIATYVASCRKERNLRCVPRPENTTYVAENTTYVGRTSKSTGTSVRTSKNVQPSRSDKRSASDRLAAGLRPRSTEEMADMVAISRKRREDEIPIVDEQYMDVEEP